MTTTTLDLTLKGIHTTFSPIKYHYVDSDFKLFLWIQFLDIKKMSKLL